MAPITIETFGLLWFVAGICATLIIQGIWRVLNPPEDKVQDVDKRRRQQREYDHE
ncbi:hypothetical protein H1O16_gp355 [Burkholderia phage BcepSaruman]|uniref:Uncharacterized protein n=1 Tax=Burkholderia phage BcepSaruman TaxID=2530032 RepID=A0A4D5ZI74_9CAUD|nr:hypothetical protein H1O16_gp355 [Burkholderia phage BcepSaruman]QBX06768.1 hypothetical protein BcepSaruman_355 [Burkholderia phage BcepSaruman]